MPLSLSKLEDELRNKVFSGNFTDFASAGNAWADAYGAYAGDAVSCLPASPTLIPAAQATLATALASAFALGFLVPPTATAMDVAFVAFWASVVFPGQTAPPVGPPGVIGPALISQWQGNPDITAEQAVTAHASILDTWTRTVVVAHVPTCTAPIT